MQVCLLILTVLFPDGLYRQQKLQGKLFSTWITVIWLVLFQRDVRSQGIRSLGSIQTHASDWSRARCKWKSNKTTRNICDILWKHWFYLLKKNELNTFTRLLFLFRHWAHWRFRARYWFKCRISIHSTLDWTNTSTKVCFYSS